VFLVIGLNHGQKKGYSKYGLNHTNLLLLLLTAGACLVANLICSNNQAGMMGRPMNARGPNNQAPEPTRSETKPYYARTCREREGLSIRERNESRRAPPPSEPYKPPASPKPSAPFAPPATAEQGPRVDLGFAAPPRSSLVAVSRSNRQVTLEIPIPLSRKVPRHCCFSIWFRGGIRARRVDLGVRLGLDLVWLGLDGIGLEERVVWPAPARVRFVQ
jgi:hypothetical protein